MDEQEEKFFDVLTKESVRGSILVGAARLEDMLEKLIWKFLFEDKKGKRKHLSGFIFNRGPLSSFWSKIEMVYALGITSKNY